MPTIRAVRIVVDFAVADALVLLLTRLLSQFPLKLDFTFMLSDISGFMSLATVAVALGYAIWWLLRKWSSTGKTLYLETLALSSTLTGLLSAHLVLPIIGAPTLPSLVAMLLSQLGLLFLPILTALPILSKVLHRRARATEERKPGIPGGQPPNFEVPPTEDLNDGEITIGTLMSGDREIRPIRIQLDDLMSHTVISGETGSGKTWLIMKILEAVSSHEVAWTVIETKGQYKPLVKALQSLIYLKPASKIAPLRIRPPDRQINSTIHAPLNRLNSSMKSPLDEIFDNNTSNLNLNDLVRRRAIIDLSEVKTKGTPEDLRLISSIIANHVASTAQQRGEQPELKHILVIDDAQDIIPETPANNTATETSITKQIASLLRTIGQGVIISTQRPNTSQNIVANAATKIFLRTTVDNEQAAKWLNLDEDQANYLKTAPEREAIVMTANYSKPIRIKALNMDLPSVDDKDIIMNNMINYPIIYDNEEIKPSTQPKEIHGRDTEFLGAAYSDTLRVRKAAEKALRAGDYKKALATSVKAVGSIDRQEQPGARGQKRRSTAKDSQTPNTTKEDHLHTMQVKTETTQEKPQELYLTHNQPKHRPTHQRKDRNRGENKPWPPANNQEKTPPR